MHGECAMRLLLALPLSPEAGRALRNRPQAAMASAACLDGVTEK